jgi:hypothetical protein
MRRGRRTECFAALVALGLGLPAAGALVGCVDVNGGAVEVAWAIFARDGRAITDCTCADPAIGYVRLELVSDPPPGNQPCAGTNSCRFACNRKVGATPFMIPPGRYLMSVVPVGLDGADIPATSVKVPPPVSRFVVTGQPTELEAFMLESANCADRCNTGGISETCTGG